MKKRNDNISPLPWSVQETPNGINIHDANGLRCAMILGLPERRNATAKFIVETINGLWLQVIKGGKTIDPPTED